MGRESGALQYAMRDRLATLGWSCIETIGVARNARLRRDAAARAIASGHRAGAALSARQQSEARMNDFETPGPVETDWRDAIYYHYYEYPGAHSVRRHYGIRTQRYKLMHFYHLGDWELYDLARDPEELNSVHDNPRYDDTMERLRGRLEDLRDRYEVPAEDPYPDPE